MRKISSKDEKLKFMSTNSVDLPTFSNHNQNDVELISEVETNVIRVPFGKRISKKKRPEKSQKIATLVLPITSFNNPTPPPFVA